MRETDAKLVLHAARFRTCFIRFLTACSPSCVQNYLVTPCSVHGNGCIASTNLTAIAPLRQLSHTSARGHHIHCYPDISTRTFLDISRNFIVSVLP